MKTYKVPMEVCYSGYFEVKASNMAEAENKIYENCKFSPIETYCNLSKKEINWNFNKPNLRVLILPSV